MTTAIQDVYSTPRSLKPYESWSRKFHGFNGYTTSAYEFLESMLDVSFDIDMKFCQMMYNTREKAFGQRIVPYREYIRIAELAQKHFFDNLYDTQMDVPKDCFFRVNTDIRYVTDCFMDLYFFHGSKTLAANRFISLIIEKKLPTEDHSAFRNFIEAQLTYYAEHGMHEDTSVNSIMQFAEVICKNASVGAYREQTLRKGKPRYEKVEPQKVNNDDGNVDALNGIDPIQAFHHYFFGEEFVDTNGFLPTDDESMIQFKQKLLDKLQPIKQT